MFRHSQEGLLLSQAALHGLRISMNAPVVRLEGVPVGPARAAIVVHDSGYGALQLAIGVRSVEGGQFAVHIYQAQLDDATTVEQAMELAQTHAEGLGFVFDEEKVAGLGDAARAGGLALWDALAAPPLGDGKIEEPQGGADLAPGELVLEQVIEDRVGSDLVHAPPAASHGLTKFRTGTPPLEQEAVAAGVAKERRTGEALGRIPLVRQRVPGESKPSALMRLLGAF